MRRKQAAIVGAMRHSWGGYVAHAWGMDELMPLTQTGKNSFGGLGATIVDALDTLWLMGLKSEFQRARDWVVNDLNFNMCAASWLWDCSFRHQS
jgi:mannosyl-oligosaccharide alpha-1,2-mannosidase